MCFSASASFIASGGLALIGGASMAAARKEHKALAAIPLLFSVQQAVEGVQWLYLDAGSSSLAAGYGFLLFAFVIWPVYIPSFVFALDKKRRKALLPFIAAGLITALYFLYLAKTETLAIRVHGSCIAYDFRYPFGWLIDALYLVSVLGPLHMSSVKAFRRFGLAITILAFVSWLFYVEAFTSVWCFFAAIVSSMFYVYIKRGRK